MLPAFSEAELRETLDRIASLTLTLSDQVEGQTTAINKTTTMANEARHAAQKTQEQSEPEHYTEFAASLIDARIDKDVERINEASRGLSQASADAQVVLRQTEKDLSESHR